MTSEKQVETAILMYLKSKGIFCFKINTGGVYDPTRKQFRANKNPHVLKGVSDILGILPNGTMLAIEVKLDKTALTNKTYPTAEQKHFIQMINDNKGVAFIARSIQDVENVLVSILGSKYSLSAAMKPLDH